MASHTALLIAAAMAVVVVGALLPTTALAAVYRVGDDTGWSLGVDYNAWASGKEFKVGDILEFVYPYGFHDVVLVDAKSFEACNFMSSDATWAESGHDRVVLADAGQHFFICAHERYCQSGMKHFFMAASRASTPVGLLAHECYLRTTGSLMKRIMFY